MPGEPSRSRDPSADPFGERAALVTIWLADSAAISPERLATWLTDPLDDRDRARAEAIRAPARRAEFVLGRALLRALLSAHATVAPAEWRFATADEGRPYVAAPASEATLDFSIAHSGGLVICAATRAGRMGIDVERLDRRADEATVARRFFSAHDADAVEAAAPERRRRAFLDRWTLREAYAKARGTALLALPREDASFDVTPGGPVVGRVAASVARPNEQWSFATLTPTPEHVAALALVGDRGSRIEVSLRRWDGTFTASPVSRA
jgi:4'-phosphopantetheinyl transferase